MDFSLFNYESITKISDKYYGILCQNDLLSSSGILVDNKQFKPLDQKRVKVIYKDFTLCFLKNYYKSQNAIVFEFESDLNLDSLGFLAYYKKSSFYCLSCKKTYNLTEGQIKCCELIHSPIKIMNPVLDRIEIHNRITNEMNYKPKNEFLDLHFSTIMDKILLD